MKFKETKNAKTGNVKVDIIATQEELSQFREPTIEEVREGIKRISDKMKKSLDNILKPEYADTYRQIKEIIERKPYLTDEDKQDLEEANAFLEVYERHIAAGSKPTAAELEALIRREPLPKIQNYGLMNDKATSELVRAAGDYIGTELQANGQYRFKWMINEIKDKENPIRVYVSMYSDKLTAQQNSIISAVGTVLYNWQLTHSGGVWATPAELWRAMTGKRNGESPSAKQKKEFIADLDFMRHEFVEVDFAELGDKNLIDTAGYEDERIIGGRMEDNIINAIKGVFVTSRGRKDEGYYLERLPILYLFNLLQGHIILVDYNLVEIPNVGEEYVVPFRDYILRRIASYKNGNMSERRILLNGIYKWTGIAPPDERVDRAKYEKESTYKANVRKLQKADNDKIQIILSTLKDKDFIKDFSPVKGSRGKIVGFEFIADKDKKRLKE